MTNGGEDWIYIYDADDERFWSYRVGGGGSIWTLRGLDGKVLRNYDAHVSWSTFEDYVYREGQLLAGFQTSGVQRHFGLDHLGTPRLITDAAGNTSAFHAYYPFGQEATTFNLDTEKMKFTGHERDLANAGSAADDLDYMHARHYTPLTTRFLSTDRGAANPRRPQSWNRYAYVVGDPVKYVDPTGELPRLSLEELARLRNWFLKKLGVAAEDLTKPGPYAGKGIAATASRKLTAETRRELAKAGEKLGCHTCGSKIFGTKLNTPVGDHQPAIALAKDGESFKLFPQCLACSNRQGGQISAMLRENKSLVVGIFSGWLGLAMDSQDVMQSEAEHLESAVREGYAMEVRETQYEMIDTIDE
jgi:RHS repeat-associated protein